MLGSALLAACAGVLAAPKKPVKAAPKKPAPVASTAPPAPLEKVLWHEALIGEVGWSLAIKVRDASRPLTDHRGAYQVFERYLAAVTANSAPYQAEKARLRALRPQIAKLFSEALTRVGTEPSRFCATGNLTPVRLAQLPEGPALLVGSIVLGDVLDTQGSTASSRASQIAQKASLPILRRMHNTLKSASPPYLGCVVTYGSKDFSDESPTTISLKGEVLGLVVSQADLGQLSAGRITEKALIERSQSYLRERDSYDMKKIPLGLE